MDKFTLAIEQWLKLRENDDSINIPVWFQVTGSSMMPFIRPFKDKVMIIAVDKEKLKVGDIVLFRAKCRGGDYCLHRIYKLDGDRVQTFGDGNRKPDIQMPRNNILGKALVIRRGETTIDCEDPKWVKRFERWNRLYKIRPVLLFPYRVANKLGNIINAWKGKKT